MITATPTDQLPANFNDLPIEERLPLWGAACCANPTPVADTDYKGRAITKCANCGAQT